MLFYKGQGSPEVEIESFNILKASLIDMLSRDGKSPHNGQKSLKRLVNVKAYSKAQADKLIAGN